ncbi:hypothetical protein HZS61_003404 [Fusarium oxysporum f. sp. conglutinans]|uniref:NB-ARC domain-containing protein n=1 Tax=Fusarium oxysporum f. sp. conglutinans TaxID=100902 RepID=A0A8H6GEU8_FUSOX|nr:hypothetical protein HZS61_003404 [Fusarium oxysporum f. sp. conglutinans]
MPITQRNHAGQTGILDPKDYKVAWIAPLEIEAKAAMYLLDERHRGRFPVSRGDDYVFQAGVMGGHNIVIATLPAGQEYGTGSAAALAGQVKKFFPNLWFGLLVGVAAGLPDLSRVPVRDIRLGDVLVGLPVGETAGLVSYDLGKETEDGFQPLRLGHSLAVTEPIVRSAIGSIKLQMPNDAEIFLPYYEKIRDCEHETGTFADPGQDNDILYLACANGQEEIVQRPRRSKADYQRTQVWYGPVGSGDKLLKNAQKRDELRDKYGIIGLEMEAAGTMNQIPVGVIRGIKEKRPEYSIFWVPVLSAETAEHAYEGIAKKLGLQKSSEDEDAKDLVCQHLSSDKAGKWLFIVDNADEEELILRSDKNSGLEEYFPQNENGIILLTTRSGQVADEFAQADSLYSETDGVRLVSEHQLASAYLDNQQSKDAIKMFEHVVAVRKDTLDEKDRDRLASEHQLANAYLYDRRFKDAIKILEHVVAVRKDTLDEKDRARLASEHVLASAYLYNQRVKDAIKILEYVVEVQKETLDEKDHDRLASEHELASAYLFDRRVEDAAKILEHVVMIQREVLAENDPSRQLSVEILQYCSERLEAAYGGDKI